MPVLPFPFKMVDEGRWGKRFSGIHSWNRRLIGGNGWNG